MQPLEYAAVAAVVALISACALWLFWRNGQLLWFGDAQAHLNIARKLVDSRTPGYDQLGTVWLPLPHLAALALVSDDRLFQSGVAGAIPSAICFVGAAVLLYAMLRSWLASRVAAACGTALFVLNPTACICSRSR